VAKKRFAKADPGVLKVTLEHMYKVFSSDGKFSRENIKKAQEISVKLGTMLKAYAYEDVVSPIACE